jgi:hypothetical protein
MFDWIAGAGGGLFVLASLVVGGRLLLLGARTRSLPELAIGGGLFLSGGLGYTLQSVAQIATGLPDDARIAFFLGHGLCNVVGLGGLALFTANVFRAGSPVARAAALCVPAGLAIAMGVQVAGPGVMEFLATAKGPWVANTWIGLAVLLWSGCEALWHHRLLARRIALGLADPVATNRMFLWGFAMCTAASISAMSLTAEALGHRVLGTALGAALVGLPGLVCASALALAFWPPAGYLGWVEGRHRA